MWTPPTGQSIIDTEVQYRASGASWPDIAYVGLTTPEIQQPYDGRLHVPSPCPFARAAVGASPWSATGSFVGALGGSRVYVASRWHYPVDSILGIRPVRQSPNVRRIHRRYHATPHGVWRLPQPACTSPVARTPDSIQVYDLGRQSPNGTKNSPFATTIPTGHWRLPQPAPVRRQRHILRDSIQVYGACPATATTSEVFDRRHPTAVGLAVTATRARDVASATTPPDSIGRSDDTVRVYRQTSEEFTVATHYPARIGGYRNPRVRRQLPMHPTASRCTTCPAIAKRPKNSPSLARAARGWRCGSFVTCYLPNCGGTWKSTRSASR